MSAILNQIEEDSGECGSRVRKNIQRSNDAGTTKPVYGTAVPIEAPKKRRSRVSGFIKREN